MGEPIGVSLRYPTPVIHFGTDIRLDQLKQEIELRPSEILSPSDDECVIYDTYLDGNPNMISHFTCVSGRCRHLQSVFFNTVCVHNGDKCELDDRAICRVPPPATGDAGVIDDCGMMAQMSGAADSPVCMRACNGDGDCATLSQNSHVTWTCAGGSCFPSLPFVFDPVINFEAFMISALIGVVFGYFPARRAAALNPIDALRHE